MKEVFVVVGYQRWTAEGNGNQSEVPSRFAISFSFDCDAQAMSLKPSASAIGWECW